MLDYVNDAVNDGSGDGGLGIGNRHRLQQTSRGRWGSEAAVANSVLRKGWGNAPNLSEGRWKGALFLLTLAKHSISAEEKLKPPGDRSGFSLIGLKRTQVSLDAPKPNRLTN